MQLPLVHSVITTGYTLKNTYSQLHALRQEKLALLSSLDQLTTSDHLSLSERDTIFRTHMRLKMISSQIAELQDESGSNMAPGDQITISKQALETYYKSK